MAEGLGAALSVELSKAFELSVFLSIKVNEVTGGGNLRARVAAPFFLITLDHYDAILTLLSRNPKICSSAFSLMRLVFETYIRGEWLMYCASSRQIENFASDKNFQFLSMLDMIDAIETKVSFDQKYLSSTYKKHWKNTLCDYTHTGILHVQRWNNVDSIEPSYSDEEVIEVVRFAKGYALLAATSFADSVIENKGLVDELFNKGKELAVFEGL